ncbi:hypothetical protein OL67_001342 [Phaeobacter piscinae]|nr:hypothetical protein OL67_001342 [Phaeobacter piscinae]
MNAGGIEGAALADLRLTRDISGQKNGGRGQW